MKKSRVASALRRRFRNRRSRNRDRREAGANRLPVMESLESRLLLAGDIAITVDSLSTTDVTPDLSGTVNDTAAAITVRVDGVNYDGTNNGDGTWSLDGDEAFSTPLANGIYDVVVLAMNDGAGTFGVDDTEDELIVDTDAPIVTVNELLTRLLQPALTGTVSDPDAIIAVTVDGNTYSAANNGDGTWTLAANVIATLSGGVYDVAVTATDGEGHIGTDYTTDELTIDWTPPVVTVDALISGEASPRLTGAVYDTEASVTVTVNGHTYAAVNNADDTWTLAAGTIAALTNGIYDVSVSAVDEAGNTGTDATENELTIRLAPRITVDTLSTREVSPELTGTVSDPDATIVVTVNGIIYDEEVTNNGDGTWTLDAGIIAPALDEGVYNVTAAATSAVTGQTGTDTTTNELDIDWTGPTVTVNIKFTTDTTPDLTGEVNEPDATVEVTIHGVTYTATNNGDGTWSLSGSAISELMPGTYDVSVTATDPAENEGTDGTTDELTIRPHVTVNTLYTGEASPELTGTVNSPDATLVVNVNGKNYDGEDVTNNGDGTWTLAADTIDPSLEDGVYNVMVTATVDGVPTIDTTLDELTIDNDAPVVTVDDQAPTADTTPEITGTVSETTATVEVQIGGHTYTATNNGDGSWTLADNTISALAAGTYTITVTATDAADNESTATGEIEIVELPTVTVDTLYTSDTTPELTGTISDPDAILVITVNGKDYTTATNNGDGTWTLANDTIDPALLQGTYNVIATATLPGIDLESTDSTTGELVIDRIAPTVQVDVLGTSDATPTITGTVSDTTATIKVTLNGKTYTATNNGDGTWTLSGTSVATLPSGIYDVAVIATDLAGNEGTDITTDELSILPAVTVDLLTTNIDSPELTGTVSDPTATIEVTVNGETYTTATNNGDGTWTLAAGLISPALADGSYDVAVTATTLDGLEGTDETYNELKIDTVAPSVGVDEMDPTDETSPEITGSVSDPAATVRVNVNGVYYTATNNGDGSWTLPAGTTVDLDSGTYTITARATDLAGNVATATGEIEIEAGPAVTVDSLLTNETSPELTGTVDDPDATVVVTVNGVAYDAVVGTEDDDYVWTLAAGTIADLPQGTYDVQVVATNAAGYEGEDETVDELVVDLTAPRSVELDELPASNDTSPALSGTVSDPTATITVTVDEKDYTATNHGDGTWSLADDVIENLAEGTYDVVVTAKDPAGNETTDTTTDELIILTTAPIITITPLDTTYRQPELNGTVNDAGVTVYVYVNGTSYEAENNGDGTWTLAEETISALSNGTYSVTVYAQDEYGNYGVDPTSGELVVRSETSLYMTQYGVRYIKYIDSDGTKVTVKLVGNATLRGGVTLSFASYSAISITYKSGGRVAVINCDAGAVISNVNVSSDTKGLSFSARGGTTRGSTLGGITGGGHLTKLVGKYMTLTGDMDMSTSGIRYVYLWAIEDADITMYDTYTGRDFAFRVYTSIEDSNIVIANGNVASFVAGSMIDSSLFVGVMGPEEENGDGVYDLPGLYDLKDDFRIKTIKVLGYRGAAGDLFVNSNIAADQIVSAYIKNAQLSNQPDVDDDGEPDDEHENFGLTANTLRKLMVRQDRITYKWVNDQWTSAMDDMEDFRVRVG